MDLQQMCIGTRIPLCQKWPRKYSLGCQSQQRSTREDEGTLWRMLRSYLPWLYTEPSLFYFSHFTLYCWDRPKLFQKVKHWT